MTQHDRGELAVLPDTAALADEAARRFVAQAQAAARGGRKFSVALSGGSTPRALYERLARPPFSEQVDWDNTHVFWGDERFVPPDDAESCFRMAREALLAQVPLPAANIYPVPTVGGTIEDAARAYAETLEAIVGGDTPRFELILLGMGPDGHTASIFPGHPEAVAPSGELVIPVRESPKPPPERVSFTYRAINAAASVMFLVAGADKAATLREVLRGPLDRARLPAQGVRPERGQLVWLVDAVAAGELSF
jgi:6-phosphogluconolactonase